MKCYKRLLLQAILLFVGAYNSYAAEVAVDITSTKLNVGDTATLTIDLVNFPTTHGGGVNVFFNQKVVNVSGVQINPVWSFVNRNGVVDNGQGQVKDIFFSHFNGLEGNIPVVTIQLVAIGEGTSNIVVTESDANPFADGNGVIPVTINNRIASVTVQGSQQDTESVETVADTGDQSTLDNSAEADVGGSTQDTVDTGVSDKINQQNDKGIEQITEVSSQSGSNKTESTPKTSGAKLVLTETVFVNSNTDNKAVNSADVDEAAGTSKAAEEAVPLRNYSNRQVNASISNNRSQSEVLNGVSDTNNDIRRKDDNAFLLDPNPDLVVDDLNNNNKQDNEIKEEGKVSDSESLAQANDDNAETGLYVSVVVVMLLAIIALIVINRKS